MLLAVMLQLPIIRWPKRQRQPRRLAENLLVSAKQLRASQSINELLIRICVNGAGLNHDPYNTPIIPAWENGVNRDLTGPEGYRDISWFTNGASPISDSRDTPVTMERQHLVMRSLQARHHHSADPLQKLVT